MCPLRDVSISLKSKHSRKTILSFFFTTILRLIVLLFYCRTIAELLLRCERVKQTVFFQTPFVAFSTVVFLFIVIDFFARQSFFAFFAQHSCYSFKQRSNEILGLGVVCPCQRVAGVDGVRRTRHFWTSGGVLVQEDEQRQKAVQERADERLLFDV